MSRFVARRVTGTSILIAAVAVLLSGCQIVSRVVTAGPADPPGPTTCVLLTVGAPTDGTDPAEVLSTTAAVIQERLVALDVSYIETTTVGPDRLAVGLPTGDATRWRGVIARTGELTFVPVPPAFVQQVVDGQPVPAGMDTTPILDGTGITSASVSDDQLGKPAVSLVMAPDAATAFDAYAAAHYGERFAIVVDGIVLSSPSINATEFDGQAQISGPFSPEQAEDLVAMLTSGRLPTSVTEVAVGEPVDGECPTRLATP